ncbi:LysM peptidoglycan-binding domain-containing protein [Telluribacter sp.]|jgi:membrane-bound lytic murein transglycosylase D|uniref:LysM peptidoglycan-binding domain-containing protein n=1 Tax=Telluribacter sp. TaxID=1978767 RepID=UPI002E0FAA56|nr:LysM peptidoglycan-binding domain-containing protein [Telluribacter sp.]
MLKFPLQYLFLFWMCVGLACGEVVAQEYPDIPSNVSFTGINVKFDAGARRIIESDVRSLMANRRFWDDKLDRAILYFPIIEGVLIEEEVPIDFKYLAVQESSLAPDAVSTSNAVGFWQFKAETATEFGIRVDNEIDERKNISSSTHAAAKYLKRSNKQFNNWVSSLYSYYLGMGGINQLVPPDWAYAREITLNARTDRYVLRFFAHKIAFESALDRHRTANTIVLLEAKYGKGRSFEEIGTNLGVNALDLRRYNLWVSGDIIPADKDYMMVIPVSSDQINLVRDRLAMGGTMPTVELAREDIGFPMLRKASVQLKGRNDPVFYEINGLPGIQARPGDQAATLAKAAKISLSSFLRYNDMGPKDPIITHEVYYLASKNKKAMVPFHTVREGETLRGISQTYGMRLRELMKYNRIPNQNLRLATGRVMWLMKKRPTNQPVEVIDKTSPDNLPGQESRPAPATTPIASTSDIPQTAAERRKYTPKLADNSQPSEAAPATTTSSPARVSTTTSQPGTGTTPVVTTETKPETKPASQTPVAQSGIYQPSRTETAPAKPAATTTTTPTPTGPTNDRVVIISEEAPRSSSTSSVASATGTDLDPWASDVSKPRTRPASPKPSESRSAGSGTEYHTVQSGQTYFSISKLYDISIDNLLALNKLTTSDKLSVGQRLLVKETSSPAAVTTRTGGNEYQTHTVIAGETLFRISQNYQASIEEIKELNSMKDNTVKVGQKLKVPKR